MKQENQIVQRVYKAKKDTQAADDLINDYLPFIKSEVSRYLKRPWTEENDDEFVIAMMAFHEAVMGYSGIRGAFLSYASVVIRNRLIDYGRKESRHRGNLSMEAPIGDEEEGDTVGDQIPWEKDCYEEMACRDATREEIEELSRQMEAFKVSLSDVADNCPRQKRTYEACRRVLDCAKSSPDILEELLRTKRLPIARLAEEGHVERKTLERHRKYLIALLLVCTNGYEIIRGHLKQVLKGGAGR